MKTKILHKTSFYLALFISFSLKTDACINETEKEISHPSCITTEGTHINASSSTSQTEPFINWEEIIKNQHHLTLPQCKEAALHFYKKNRLTLSAELFRHYLINKPTGDEASFYKTAARALQLDKQNELASQSWDLYFMLTTLVSASDYLHAGRTYYFVAREDCSIACLRAYIEHPDFEEVSKIHLFETAEAYIHLGDFHKSTHYWNLYLARSTTKPTYFDYTNAAFAFERAQKHIEATDLWKKAFAMNKMDLDVSTFMSALTSFNETNDHESMLWLLGKIQKRMPNPPSHIYRQAANIYTGLEKDEKAAHMWDLFFLHPESQPTLEDYASAARSYFHCKDLIRAHEMWGKYFSHTNVEFDERSYKSFGMVLSGMGRYEESTAIWRKYFTKKSSKDFLFHNIYARDLCGLGRFDEAAQQYDFCLDELIASKDDTNLIYATLAYCMTGKMQQASKIHNKRVALGFLPSHMLIKPTKSHSHSKSTKKKSSNRTSSNMSSDMLQNIKLSVGQNTFDRATTYYNQSKNATHPELQELRETLMSQYNQCLAYFLSLKNGSAPKTPSVGGTSTSASSTPSSSTSSSTSEPSTSTSSALQDLQRITTQMENTFALFSRTNAKIQAEDKKQRYKELLQSFAHATSAPFDDRTPAKKNFRSEYPREEKERRTPYKSSSSHISMNSSTSSSVSSSEPSSSSSMSTSPSTSLITDTPMDIQWHITPAALNQYEKLSKEQLIKFKNFKSEIEQNPWLDQSIIGTFSGKAKKLKDFSNLYSRRFDKKNRLVYKIEEHEGQIRATILGLLTHYKLLERS